MSRQQWFYHYLKNQYDVGSYAISGRNLYNYVSCTLVSLALPSGSPSWFGPQPLKPVEPNRTRWFSTDWFSRSGHRLKQTKLCHNSSFDSPLVLSPEQISAYLLLPFWELIFFKKMFEVMLAEIFFVFNIFYNKLYFLILVFL